MNSRLRTLGLCSVVSFLQWESQCFNCTLVRELSELGTCLVVLLCSDRALHTQRHTHTHVYILLLLSRFSRVRPHRRQPTRFHRPWDSPGKNTGVGCHFLLQCMKVKSESEAGQSCLTLSDPMDHSPPASSIHGIFQARVLEWGAIAFSDVYIHMLGN